MVARCGLSERHIRKLEAGATQPSLLAIHAIADALLVPPSWLLEQSSDVPPVEDEEKRWRY